MDEDSYTAGAVTHRFLRACEICGLAIVASLGLAGRVRATYLHLNYAPAYAERYSAGDYIDRKWYYLLDDGQYYYLDNYRDYLQFIALADSSEILTDEGQAVAHRISVGGKELFSIYENILLRES